MTNVKDFSKFEIKELKKIIKELIKTRSKTRDLETKAFLFQQIDEGIKLIRETEPGWEPV